jgi:ABC-type branched-subunit amino acid transport system permease subunit
MLNKFTLRLKDMCLSISILVFAYAILWYLFYLNDRTIVVKIIMMLGIIVSAMILIGKIDNTRRGEHFIVSVLTGLIAGGIVRWIFGWFQGGYGMSAGEILGPIAGTIVAAKTWVDNT